MNELMYNATQSFIAKLPMLDLYKSFICFLVVEFTTQYTIIIISARHQLYHKDGIEIIYDVF